MGKCKHSREVAFKLEGHFLGYVLEDGYKVKYVRLETPSGEFLIKLSKEVRASLFHEGHQGLNLGDSIQVKGYQELDEKKGTIKFKAAGLTKLHAVAPPLSSTAAWPLAEPSPPAELPKPDKKACILVCQKSDCCKRGGRAIVAALEETLRDRDLTDTVTIRGTGCMKRCKTGPHVVMPDKTRYSQISPTAVPTLVDRHFQV